MTFQHILVDTGPVTRVTLNRPQRRNPLSLEMMTEVAAALIAVGADRSVEAVVIAANGPAFSAGHDLAEMIDRDETFYDKLFDACTVMMELIHKIPQPVIARVHGIATAAGCQLVAACDLAVAADTATFATPGVKIGLFCSTPMVPISRAVGRKRAMEMLLTGEPISAQTARDWGLINRVVPADALDATVDGLVAAVTRFSPAVIGIGKAAFYRQIDLSEPDAYEHTTAVMSHNAAMVDAQEGIDAFLGKRAARWSSSSAPL